MSSGTAMTDNRDKDELDEFYEDAGRRNLLLKIKSPLAWYNKARSSIEVANMIRTSIEEDIPNEGGPHLVSVVFEPSRSGDIFWLQTLRAVIRNDIVGDHFVGNEVVIQTEETIDKNGIGTMSDLRYKKLHHLYPNYMNLVGIATENLLKAIYVMRHTDSIHSESNPEIVENIAKWGHKLHKLADGDANGLRLGLNETEEHLLRILEEFVTSAKYPGPKTAERYTNFVRGKNHPNPYSQKERANFSKDEETIKDFYKRLLKILDNEVKDRLKKLNN